MSRIQRNNRIPLGKVEFDPPKVGFGIADNGDELVRIPFSLFAEARAYVSIRLFMSSGTVGVRLLGDVADRATYTPSSPMPATIDISDVEVGVKNLSVFSREDATTMTYIEALLTEN